MLRLLKSGFIEGMDSNLYTVSLLVQKAAVAIVGILLARTLSVYEFGLFSVYLNYGFFLLLVTNFGFSQYLVVSARGRLDLLQARIGGFIELALLTTASITAIASLVADQYATILALVLVKSFIENRLSLIFLSYFQVSNRFRVVSLLSLAYSCALLSIGAGTYLLSWPLKYFLVFNVSIGILHTLVNFLIIRPAWLSPYGLWQFIRDLESKLVYYGFSMVTASLYLMIPGLCAAALFKKELVAVYFAIYNIAYPLILVTIARSHNIIPQLVVADRKNSLSIIRTSAAYLCGFNLIALILLGSWGRKLLLMVYGKSEYVLGYPLLLAFLVGNVFLSGAYILSSFMIAHDQQKQKLIIQCQGILVVSICCWLFSSSLMGLALAYMCVAGFMLVQYSRFCLVKFRQEW